MGTYRWREWRNGERKGEERKKEEKENEMQGVSERKVKYGS